MLAAKGPQPRLAPSSPSIVVAVVPQQAEPQAKMELDEEKTQQRKRLASRVEAGSPSSPAPASAKRQKADAPKERSPGASEANPSERVKKEAGTTRVSSRTHARGTNVAKQQQQQKAKKGEGQRSPAQRHDSGERAKGKGKGKSGRSPEGGSTDAVRVREPALRLWAVLLSESAHTPVTTRPAACVLQSGKGSWYLVESQTQRHR